MFKFVLKQKCNKFIYAHQNIEQFINVIKMIICKKNCYFSITYEITILKESIIKKKSFVKVTFKSYIC